MDTTSSLAELFDHDEAFHAPTPHRAIDLLLAERDHAAADVIAINGYMAKRAAAATAIIDANKKRERFIGEPATFFAIEPAMAALDATFWSRALALTDLWDTMPTPRRQEWSDALREHKPPPFTEENVEATLSDLLGRRDDFLAERVDGIFRALSHTHVTNQPEGFSKRFIVHDIAYTHRAWDRRSYVQDLRVVAAKFLGYAAPDRRTLDALFKLAEEHRGQWQTVDGGAFRIRVYLLGTAHFEVHPDLAWRLNATLAHLHPAAIPSSFRERPKKTPKAFATLQRPLPARVLAHIAEFSLSRNGKVLQRYHNDAPPEVFAEARDVLCALGGVFEGTVRHPEFHFPFHVEDLINQLLSSGLLPDKDGFQFFPTPPALAARLIEAAAVGPTDRVLEPSAGVGGLAQLLPADRTTVIELSELHCAALRGLNLASVVQGDFLALAPSYREAFDVVAMNPPFSKGRAQAHLDAAAACVAPGGRLVAILPASMRGVVLPGFSCESSEAINGAFVDASVSVVLLFARRAA